MSANWFAIYSMEIIDAWEFENNKVFETLISLESGYRLKANIIEFQNFLSFESFSIYSHPCPFCDISSGCSCRNDYWGVFEKQVNVESGKFASARVIYKFGQQG